VNVRGEWYSFTMNNFQAESYKSGNEFEELVKSVITSGEYVSIERDYYLDGIGCEVDYKIVYADRTEYIECKGGVSGGNKRPGASRTDNVKKAVANGAVMKAVYPDYTYVVYFSAPPKPGNYADQMLQTALAHKIIDEVRYL
jgi:hypothetical protein